MSAHLCFHYRKYHQVKLRTEEEDCNICKYLIVLASVNMNFISQLLHVVFTIVKWLLIKVHEVGYRWFYFLSELRVRTLSGLCRWNIDIFCCFEFLSTLLFFLDVGVICHSTFFPQSKNCLQIPPNIDP